MNLIIFIWLLSTAMISFALPLPDYLWNLTDVTSKKLSKEKTFKLLDRSFIKIHDSICSNRALMWSHDLKNQYQIDSGKIFLFFTKPEKETLKTWWYHVAPVITENGKMWVIDPGFRGFIDGPLTTRDWLKKLAKSENCKEIKSHETELIELIFTSHTFPKETAYGQYDCYYKVTPHTFWTPKIVAENLLGKDRSGRPVRVDREIIVQDELYQACMEATTNKLEYALGTNKKVCKIYSGIE